MPKLVGASRQSLAMCLGHKAAVRGEIVQAAVESTGAFGANLDPLQRSECSGKNRLQIVGNFLIPKQEKAVLLECGAHGLIGNIARGDIKQADAAHLHAKIRVQRNELIAGDPRVYHQLYHQSAFKPIARHW